jgi:hypothetical protein
VSANAHGLVRLVSGLGPPHSLPARWCADVEMRSIVAASRGRRPKDPCFPISPLMDENRGP